MATSFTPPPNPGPISQADKDARAALVQAAHGKIHSHYIDPVKQKAAYDNAVKVVNAQLAAHSIDQVIADQLLAFLKAIFGQ